LGYSFVIAALGTDFVIDILCGNFILEPLCGNFFMEILGGKFSDTLATPWRRSSCAQWQGLRTRLVGENFVELFGQAPRNKKERDICKLLDQLK